jgi:hypothetical protein
MTARITHDMQEIQEMEIDAGNTHKLRESTDYIITKKSMNTSIQESSGTLRRSSRIKARRNIQQRAQQENNCSKAKIQNSEKKKKRAKLLFDSKKKTEPMTEEEALSIFQAT